MKLPQAQAAVLRAADADEDRRIDEVAAEADLKPETATRAAFELEDQGSSPSPRRRSSQSN